MGCNTSMIQINFLYRLPSIASSCNNTKVQLDETTLLLVFRLLYLSHHDDININEQDLEILEIWLNRTLST